MHRLASTAPGRLVLCLFAASLRPLRFLLGLSRRVPRPIHLLITL